MIRFNLRHIRVFVFLLVLAFSSAVNAAELKPFSSDGCSLFPDSNLMTKKDWCVCCFDHDVVYWRGGPESERVRADLLLKRCVFEKTNNAVLAEAMFQGVRVGGSPYFYNGYHWGYGWAVRRYYQSLSPTEHALADSLLHRYYQEQKASACALANRATE